MIGYEKVKHGKGQHFLRRRARFEGDGTVESNQMLSGISDPNRTVLDVSKETFVKARKKRLKLTPHQRIFASVFNAANAGMLSVHLDDVSVDDANALASPMGLCVESLDDGSVRISGWA